MALTKSKERVYAADVPEIITELPVAAGDTIHRGAALELGAGGYLQRAVGDGTFAGFAMDDADNSGGAAGDKSVRVKLQGAVELDITTDNVSLAHVLTGIVEATDDDTFRIETGSAITGQSVGRVSRVIQTGVGGRVLCYFQGHSVRSL